MKKKVIIPIVVVFVMIVGNVLIRANSHPDYPNNGKNSPRFAGPNEYASPRKPSHPVHP